MPVPYDVEGALSLGMEGEFNTIPAQYDILVGTSPWLRYVEYFVYHVDQDSGGDQHFFDIVRTTPYQNDTIWSTTGWKTVKFFERMDSSLQTASLDRRADGVGQDHDAAAVTLAVPAEVNTGGYSDAEHPIYVRTRGDANVTYMRGTVKAELDAVDGQVEMNIPVPKRAIIRVKAGAEPGTTGP